MCFKTVSVSIQFCFVVWTVHSGFFCRAEELKRRPAVGRSRCSISGRGIQSFDGSRLHPVRCPANSASQWRAYLAAFLFPWQ